MADVFLSVITDKESSEARVVPFETQEECVLHNARVALKLAKEANEADGDEDGDELVDDLQSAYDDKDMDLFSDRLENSFIDDRFSFEAVQAEVMGSHLSIQEEQLPSWS